ncbi:MAG: hypothetical protein ACLQEQ_02560 [Nitrososphaerales archaeon]
MAPEHLWTTPTEGHHWLHVVSERQIGDSTPSEIRSRILAKRGFVPAAMTFHSVVCRLRREGLMKRPSDSLRSADAATPRARTSF